jgi:hypothetical protein
MYLGFKSLQIYERLVYICYTKHLPMKTKLLIYKIVGKAIPYLYLIIAIYSFFAFIFIALSNSEYWAIIAGIFLIFLIFSLFAFMAIKNILTIDILMHRKEEREQNLKVIADNYIKPFQRQDNEIMKRWNDMIEFNKSYLDKYEALKKYSDNPYILGDLSKETMFLIYNRCMELMSKEKPDAIGIIDIELTHDVVDFVRSLNFGLHRMSNQAWVLTYKKEISL